MAEWYLYAIVTMLFFSVANITLKELLNQDLVGVLTKNLGAVIPAALTIIAGIIIAYFLFLSKLPFTEKTPFLLVGFVILASLGFIFLMLAVSSGKIAPVTAIVSTSSITVAVLSIILLHDALSAREIGGIALAFVGGLLLVFK